MAAADSARLVRSTEVVLHADDFGMSVAVTEGILDSFRAGLLTSTSLLANAPDAERAVQQWRVLLCDAAAGRLESLEQRQRLGAVRTPFDLGAHLNLTQGRPLTGERYPSELLDSAGRFPGVFGVFRGFQRLSERCLAGARAELTAQLSWLADQGIRSTHANGHQYIELIPGIADWLPGELRRFGIRAIRWACEPGLAWTVLRQGRVAAFGLGLVKRHFARRAERGFRAAELAMSERFFGTCHAGSVDLATMARFLRIGCGTRIEIGLHPGRTAGSERGIEAADGWSDPLAASRGGELELLTSAKLAELLERSGARLGRIAEWSCGAEQRRCG